MAYLTVADLKLKNVIDEIKNAVDGDELRLQSLLDHCTSLIDAYVGSTFKSELAKTIYVDGENRNKIALPQRIYNIISVATTDGYMYNNSNLRIAGDKKRAILNVAEDFEEGFDNIEVKGDFGWETVPSEVIDCLVILCNGNYGILNDAEKLENASGPFDSERIGDYSYSLKKQINNITGEQLRSTGNVTVDQILDKYRVANDFYIGVI
jgi:hypothetical protein